MLSERRNAPKENGFVSDIHLYVFSEKDDNNLVNRRAYKLCAFLTNEQVFETMDYNNQIRGTQALPLSEWYFKMTRVLYLGAINGQTLVQLANESTYFHTNKKIAHNLGFHVYINKLGILRLMMCYSHRNNSQILVRTDGSINDVLPKFKQMLIGTNRREQALIIATKVQITDITRGDRDGGRCGSVSFGGVFDIYEHRVICDNLYHSLNDIKLPYFGLYLCDDSKLVFLDLCRKCNHEDMREVHHNRTLYQSGAFLIVEGTLCFQFARYFNEYFTAEDLEQMEIITQNSILGKINPIFFLGKTDWDSSAWGLISIEAIREEHWSLIIPDNAVFESIDDYVTAIDIVMARQSVRVAPYSKNVRNDQYLRSMKPIIHFQTSNNVIRTIDWKKLSSTVGHKKSREHFNKNPQQFISKISKETIDVILSQGAIFNIPVIYEFNGQLAEFLTSFRYKLRSTSNQWSYLVYFRINGFWYKRQSGYKSLPLVLVSMKLNDLPNLFKYGNKELVLSGNDYFDFYRYTETHTQNAFLVSSLQWRSHGEYCTNA